MKLYFLFSLLFINLTAFSQLDSIFMNNEIIACQVTEVTQDGIRFKYPGEDLINSIYKNAVQKIKFRSGRVQSFSESTSYKKVMGVEDIENVSLTQVETEVKGLFKLGDVTSKAVGTTIFSSIVKVKERAIKKLKIQAAMMGANIVYLTQNSTVGNEGGSSTSSGHSTNTILSGVAYSNILPDYKKFMELIGEKRNFQTKVQYKLSGSDADVYKMKFENNFQVSKIYSENGLIMIEGKIDKVEETQFRVTNFTEASFLILAKDGQKIYNYVVNF